VARTYPHFLHVNGRQVGYAHFNRDGAWAVLFKSGEGKRLERMTRAEVRGKNPGPDFHAEAAGLIAAAYSPSGRPPSAGPPQGWDALLDEVEADNPGVRPETIRSFRAAAKAFLSVQPEIASPLAVTEEQVDRFARKWLAAPKANGKRRSPVSLSYHMRALSAFSNHLTRAGLLPKGKNLFKGYQVPKGERTKKPTPKEEQVAAFFRWVADRYPDWHTLRTLLEVKAVSACRTADLCRLKTADLTPTAVTFTAAASKTKTSRTLPLSPELAAALRASAGAEWVWQGFFDDLRRFRKQTNGLPPAFSPDTVEYVLINLFREFSDAHPGQPRLTPHAFRRRGITLTVKAMGGNIEKAAAAIGVHPQTAARHYLDEKEAFETEQTMRAVADLLKPRFDRAG
jgi:integrase